MPEMVCVVDKGYSKYEGRDTVFLSFPMDTILDLDPKAGRMQGMLGSTPIYDSSDRDAFFDRLQIAQQLGLPLQIAVPEKMGEAGETPDERESGRDLVARLYEYSDCLTTESTDLNGKSIVEPDFISLLHVTSPATEFLVLKFMTYLHAIANRQTETVQELESGATLRTDMNPNFSIDVYCGVFRDLETIFGRGLIEKEPSAELLKLRQRLPPISGYDPSYKPACDEKILSDPLMIVASLPIAGYHMKRNANMEKEVAHIVRSCTNPEDISQRIFQWIHANVQSAYSAGKSEAQTFEMRAGDSDQRAVLHVTMERIAGNTAYLAAKEGWPHRQNALLAAHMRGDRPVLTDYEKGAYDALLRNFMLLKDP